MKILVTGFAPFGGEKTNPSYEAVKLLPQSIGGIEIIKKELPVSFDNCIVNLDRHISEHDPDWILCTGQAGGRSKITVERVGINVDDARVADNVGVLKSDDPVVPQGPAAYFSTLPVKAMVASMQSAGIPTDISNSAGTYVCNHILYGSLHLCATKYPQKKCGFIHVPYDCGQVMDKYEAPSLPIGMIAKGFEVAILAIKENEKENGKENRGE